MVEGGVVDGGAGPGSLSDGGLVDGGVALAGGGVAGRVTGGVAGAVVVEVAGGVSPGRRLVDQSEALGLDVGDALLHLGLVGRLRLIAQVGLVARDGLLALAGLFVRFPDVVEQDGILGDGVGRLELDGGRLEVLAAEGLLRRREVLSSGLEVLRPGCRCSPP